MYWGTVGVPCRGSAGIYSEACKGVVLGFTAKRDAAWRGSVEPHEQQQGISSCCLVPRKAPLSSAKRPEKSLTGNSSALGAKTSTGCV